MGGEAMFYSLIFFLLPLALIVSVVYLISRARHGERNGIRPHQPFLGYFYFVTAASVITMAVGRIYFIRVAVGRAFGGGEIADDVTIACVLLGTGLLICIPHLYGKRILEKRMEEVPPSPRRTYLFGMLIGLSVAGLVALPVAMYQTIHHFVGDTYFRSTPAAALAVAIVLLPLWAYYVYRVFREIKQKGEPETES